MSKTANTFIQMPAVGSSPAIQTSKKTIIYKESKWKVHKFTICSGEVIAVVEVLKMCGSLFIWIGSPGQHIFTELALGVPEVYGDSGKSTSTTILGLMDSTESSAMARRLASMLKKPVYVSCNVLKDRFTSPLIEKGLLMEIKHRPECF